jgi:hypothetical protein
MQAKNSNPMTVERAVFAMAGTFILVSVLLGVLWTPWALAFTAFVGANMLQASITGFCPAAMIFAKLGLSAGCIFKG